MAADTGPDAVKSAIAAITARDGAGARSRRENVRVADDPLSAKTTGAVLLSGEQLTEPEGEGDEGVGVLATATFAVPLLSGVITIEEAAFVTVI